MLEKIIRFSIYNKFLVGLLVAAMIGLGIYSMMNVPIDAVPDITNNQVQIVTVSPSLAPQEVEQFITYPVEMAMANIQDVNEIRSISRYGLSVVTVVFEEHVPVLDARQLVGQSLQQAKDEIPAEYGEPELMPITTGLGEIYQYTVDVRPGYENEYSPLELRTIHDWIIKRQLNGIPGIVEVSSFGGFLKQYQVSVNPSILRNYNVTLDEINRAIQNNNQNTGGSYIQKGPYAWYIRTNGLLSSVDDIENIVIKTRNNVPILIRDVADVEIGSPPRFGAMTKDGQGEAVGGITLMLKGGNASKVIADVKDRIEQIRKNLPEGIEINPYLDRSNLVQKVIKTVSNNLIEGGLIVIFVLVLLLGNFRAGIIVASVIPLSMLFAFSMMYLFGVTATVMSLGAIDFGLIVDGTVIIVEGIIHHLQKTNSLQKFSQKDMDKAVLTSSLRIRKSASFGAIIILIVYFPILSLQGIEGKMFRPMALTVSFAIIGALILSFTYVPMLSSLFLSKKSSSKTTFADRIMDFLYRTYKPVFLFALRNKMLILGTSALVMLGAVFVYNRLGAVFIPTLDEGDLAMQMTIPPGSSLDESINASTKAEKVLLKNFPEVKHVVSKIGTAEVPTDPMAIEDADIMIILKDRKEWSSAETRYELVNRMKEKLSVITGASFEFTQPIQLRFNELLTGAKSDVVVKIYGEELDILFEKANMAARIISQVQGAADIKVEQIEGLPQMVINYKREQIARYGLNIENLNTIVRTALSGEKAGVFFEGEKKFDIVVRLQDRYRKDTEQIKNLFIRTPTGLQIPLGEVATIDFIEGPMQISRDGTQRRISIGINVRNRDVESLVNEIQDKLETEFKLPPGYYVTYGGQFENLQSAMARLKIVVPIALAMIFILLYFAFGSLRQALIIFTTIPLSAIGGVISLWIRGMPFSISAGVGFIALFGVAVLDGIVLINYMNELKSSGVKNLHRRLILGTKARLRPVTVTSAVASLGFLPMAVSTTAGAEVQRPLATVVIGGIITSTLLTMVAMPLVYYYFEKISRIKIKPVITILILFFTGLSLTSQAQQRDSVKQLTLHESVDYALDGHPLLHNASLRVQQAGINRKTAMNFGKTEFSIQHGQINSELTDDYISVKQNLGSPLEFLTLSKYHKEQQDVEQAKQKLIANEIKRNVTAKYFEILWLKNKLQILRDNFILYEDFLRFANLKYEIGESNYLSKLVAENTKEELENRIYQIESMIKTSEKSFNQVICSDEYYSTENIPVFRITPGIFRDTSMTGCEICYNVYKEQLDVAEKEISVKRSALSPELYVGYFTQKIDKVSGFNGIEGGLQIPLLFFSQHAAIKSAKIGFQIAKNELEYKRMFMFTEREKLREKLERLNSTLEVKKRAADRAGKIIETAYKLYQNQEIEYFEFVRNTSDAIDVKLKYLDLMNTYNQTFIELKYLTF